MGSMKKRLAVYESNYENKSKNPRSDAAPKFVLQVYQKTMNKRMSSMA